MFFNDTATTEIYTLSLHDALPICIEKEGGCCGWSAVEDARRVAHMLDIPYYVMNFRDEFQEKVIDYFVKEYRRGRTPNPCIACNRYVSGRPNMAQAGGKNAAGIADALAAAVHTAAEAAPEPQDLPET